MLGSVIGRARDPPRAPLASEDAYRLWAESYDAQADNVILFLEDDLFMALLSSPGLSLAGQRVLDVGCGTGRHWGRLLAARPSLLAGADTSPEMLARLRAKFPEAEFPTTRLHHIRGGRLDGVGAATVDLLASTLTMGHIPDLGEALGEWDRVLRPGARLLLTDFHPEAFRLGMRRTFIHGDRTVEAEHHLHAIADFRALFADRGWRQERFDERRLDDRVRAHFQRQDYLPAFDRFRGAPLVFGFLLRKGA